MGVSDPCLQRFSVTGGYTYASAICYCAPVSRSRPTRSGSEHAQENPPGNPDQRMSMRNVVDRCVRKASSIRNIRASGTRRRLGIRRVTPPRVGWPVRPDLSRCVRRTPARFSQWVGQDLLAETPGVSRLWSEVSCGHGPRVCQAGRLGDDVTAGHWGNHLRPRPLAPVAHDGALTLDVQHGAIREVLVLVEQRIVNFGTANWRARVQPRSASTWSRLQWRIGRPRIFFA